MRFNPFKNIRLSTQLFALVAISLAIAAGLMAYAMQQVRATQGTLKHTIDNRMVSGQAIQGVADALSAVARGLARCRGKEARRPQEAHDLIKDAVDKAHDDWDRYFLGEMIPEEQALADETTPMLDAAYNTIDKLLKKLENDEVADLAAWRNGTLRPALADGARNLKQLIEMQLKAANMDLDKAGQDYQAGAAQWRHPAVEWWRCWRSCSRGSSSAAPCAGWAPIRARRPKSRVASPRAICSSKWKRSRHDEVSLMGALRQMKASLLHSKLDYEGQINAIAKVQGVIECTPAGEIINANDIFLKLLGYTLDDVSGKNYSMFVDAEVRGTDELPGFLAGAGARRKPPG